ncbi:DUF2189 domain-containing protein [Siculibacillus lacustris]|uniref:DUF2189 domain-containing protein n=1 Tax=Siculibacillus lacustris TaxID=1549641 RepID=A0A4Q9VNJ0_9HYPH|nr:DUF2189 domain-containing protein [Siculibacillus lacustris]TBW37215.1 DUF2189 domain-containing protein [Siculibacillus lacustris]
MTDLVAATSPLDLRPTEPRVRAITVDDISASLADGLRDFRAAPTFGLLVGAVYVLAGNVLFWIAATFDMMFLAYPLAAGFALVAPFAATGLYETSRRLGRGESTDFVSLIGAVPPHARRELGYMALVTVFGLIGWIYAAGFVYALFFGLRPLEAPDLITAIVSTPRGVAFLMAGNLIGGVIATVIFSLSALSYPLLLDRDHDFVTAMIVSIRAVFAAPWVMLGWGVFIGTMLAIAILPMFLGLLVVLPWLGHATWHLYRRAVPAV